MACIENIEERGRENLGFCGKSKNKKVKRQKEERIGHSNEKYGKIEEEKKNTDIKERCEKIIN